MKKINFEKYIKTILDANVYDAAIETPIQFAPSLSKKIANEVYIKREDLQPIFSFKVRGAFNKMRQLPKDKLLKGVVAASAGNHAQGVALSAQILGCQAIIVMPQTTPAIKINGVKARGAEVVLVGDTYDEASQHAKQLVADRGMTYIHPYDDEDVLAGQGTIAVEIFKQFQKPIDFIFVPVGGGGLAAGISLYAKYLKPDIHVIAVEPEDAACLKLALATQQRGILKEVGLFADGVAVAQIGEKTFDILRHTIDEVVTVSTDEICDAIKDIFEDTRSIAEPAGAVALAGLKQYAKQQGIKNKTLLTIESGANTNFDRLRYICERSYLGEKRELLLSVEIPEQPGSFMSFCQSLGRHNITEFNYRYTDSERAQIFAGIQMANEEDKLALLAKLKSNGYRYDDLSDNDMAKEHVRHMVGGRSLDAGNEVIFSVEFPDRPGALMQFLSKLGSYWNISLFHYRNHGAAWGKVLVGLQAREQDKKAVVQLIDELGFPYADESNNLAYLDFLKH